MTSTKHRQPNLPILLAALAFITITTDRSPDTVVGRTLTPNKILPPDSIARHLRLASVSLHALAAEATINTTMVLMTGHMVSADQTSSKRGESWGRSIITLYTIV